MKHLKILGLGLLVVGPFFLAGWIFSFNGFIAFLGFIILYILGLVVEEFTI